MNLAREILDAQHRLHKLIEALALAHQSQLAQMAHRHKKFINRSIGQHSRHVWR